MEMIREARKVIEISPQLGNILIGSVFTVLSTITVQKYRAVRQVQKTRTAIKNEILSSKGTLDSIHEDVSNNDDIAVRKDIGKSLSRKMYQQNLSELGNLSDEEVENTLLYYQEIERLVSSHERYNAVRERRYNGERTDERDLELYKISIENASETAILAREDLLGTLKQKTEKPRYRRLIPNTRFS